MHGRTAGNDAYLGTLREYGVRDAVIPEIRQTVHHPRKNGILKGIRLFVDFLKHEMRVSVLHGRIHVPADLQCFRLHAVKVHIIYTDFVWRQAHDAAFRDHEILPGIGNQGSKI